MKKRVLSVLVTILTICVLAFTLTACGESNIKPSGSSGNRPASEGLEYTLNTDGESYRLTHLGTCHDTDIVIPNTYNGKPVTSIGEWVFDGCSSLTSVYYDGTEEDWKKISINNENYWLTNATRYYYSESQPTEDGNYWHYVDGESKVW